MVKDEAIKAVPCPSCKAEAFSDCVDLAGVSVPIHVARRRRWRIENAKK